MSKLDLLLIMLVVGVSSTISFVAGIAYTNVYNEIVVEIEDQLRML